MIGAAGLALVVSASMMAGAAQSPEAAKPTPPSASKGAKLKPKTLKLKPAPQSQIDTAREAARKRGVGFTGVHLPLDEKTLAKGNWQKAADGKAVWLLKLESPGAVALRLHFLKFDAGKGQLWTHTAADSDGPFTGKGPMNDGDFWTAVLDGSSVTIEYVPASGVKEKSLPFQADKLAHQITKVVP